ncbi:hypothetical protein NMG60_11037475 [Bertholletia excelsa]
MLSPTSPSTAATTTTTSTYTTIPISGSDVISRSVQNLSNFVSRHRPWQELIAAGSFDRPDSLSGAGVRLRRNVKYFGINYAIIVSICAAFALVGAPIALIIYALVFALWLVLLFSREDPMVAWGHHVDDRLVIASLVVVSVAAVWFTGMVNSLLIGIALGLLISAVHGVLRNPEGLFLDEDDAATNGLIGSPVPSSSNRKEFSA